jgi:predicted transcriptional regulator
MLYNRVNETRVNTMQTADIKDAAHQLIDQLDHPTWAELAYEVAVKASIEQGLNEAKAGDLTSQEDIEKEFGISQ